MTGPTAAPRRPPLPLLIALLQGVLLYGLHRAVMQQHWPATQPALLSGLYLVLLFLPVALQLQGAFLRQLHCWLQAAALAALLFYAGWHAGSSVDAALLDPARGAQRAAQLPDVFAPLLLVTAVWGLHLLPFLQNRLERGSWSIDYPTLFANAWRNIVALAEAGLFTLLFWGLLALWQQLFMRLGFPFFRELFTQPAFFYPATALCFGTALHLVGSIDRMVSAVLEQILNVFKWLAVIAGLLLALFSLALLPSLPALLGSGDRAIGAQWLLWLIAILVLLLNAAWRDGRVERAYPRWLALGLRIVVPLMVLVAGTALYALIWRAARYGLTVSRVWGLIVSAALALYALGYAYAAIRRGAWFAQLGRVNVGIALAMIAIVYLALTPVLSPQRLAANSQYRQILDGAGAAAGGNARDDRFALLRFDAGHYGIQHLRQLAALENHPQAARIRERAGDALARSVRGVPGPVLAQSATATLDRLIVHPQGRELDAGLRAALVAALQRPQFAMFSHQEIAGSLHGLYLDLDGHEPEEFLLLTPTMGMALEHSDNAWKVIGSLMPEGMMPKRDVFDQALNDNDIRTETRRWPDLRIGEQRFRVFPQAAMP